MPGRSKCAAGQPSAPEIESAAREAGLDYRFIPVAGGFSDDDVAAMAEALDAASGPALAFCRSGTRSTTLWALSQAGEAPAGEIIAAAANAGYDMSHLAGHLNQK